jgi:hypothetical protein
MELLNLEPTDLEKEESSVGNAFRKDKLKEARDIELVEAVVLWMFWLAYVI